MLRFDDHVSQICTKASKQLAVLKRIGRFKETRSITMNIFRKKNIFFFKSFVKNGIKLYFHN